VSRTKIGAFKEFQVGETIVSLDGVSENWFLAEIAAVMSTAHEVCVIWYATFTPQGQTPLEGARKARFRRVWLNDDDPDDDPRWERPMEREDIGMYKLWTGWISFKDLEKCCIVRNATIDGGGFLSEDTCKLATARGVAHHVGVGVVSGGGSKFAIPPPAPPKPISSRAGNGRQGNRSRAAKRRRKGSGWNLGSK